MGKDGFDNENLLLNAINNKKYVELNDNLKNMIQYMSEIPLTSDTIISAYKIGGVNKTDLVIGFNNQEYNLSIKKGGGNSVHQEKVDEFLSFLKKEYNISDELKNDILYFIWGDGTLDGTGNLSDRISGTEFKKRYPEKIENMKKFFYNNKRDLINRFLIKGVKSNSTPDYLYYGTPDNGTIVNAQDVLDWVSDDKNERTRTTIPVGRLSFQAWNRNINGGDKSEKKRGVIQLKWGSVGEDLKIILKGNEDGK